MENAQSYDWAFLLELRVSTNKNEEVWRKYKNCVIIQGFADHGEANEESKNSSVP